MLIIGKSISYDPVKLQLVFCSATFDLFIRPLDGEAMEKIHEKAKVYRYAENPATGRQELGAMTDDAAFDREMFDHIIADWNNIGAPNGEPALLTKENKLKLVYRKPGPGDKPLWNTVLEAARDLAIERHKAMETSTKNS